MGKRFSNFNEFFPYYMSQHQMRPTRIIHFIGTSVALIFLILFFLTFKGWLIPVGLISVYGPAFFSHYYFEKNRPATFQNPFYSVGGDLKMWFLILTGRLKP